MLFRSTSAFGSALAVTGLVVLVVRIPQVGGQIEEVLRGTPLLLGAVVVVPMAIGIAYQLRFTEKRDSRAESAASGDGDGAKKKG